MAAIATSIKEGHRQIAELMLSRTDTMADAQADR